MHKERLLPLSVLHICFHLRSLLTSTLGGHGCCYWNVTEALSMHLYGRCVGATLALASWQSIQALLACWDYDSPCRRDSRPCLSRLRAANMFRATTLFEPCHYYAGLGVRTSVLAHSRCHAISWTLSGVWRCVSTVLNTYVESKCSSTLLLQSVSLRFLRPHTT